jgi:putative photosynthetic complex assembly protein 2
MSLVNSVLIVIATWWLGTGMVLYLQQRLKHTGAALITTLCLLSMTSLAVLKYSSLQLESWHSYAGFIAAVVLWGCLELSYFTGLIGGVHKLHCPKNCNTAMRFRLALGASIWHELSVLAVALIVLELCRHGSNPSGMYTFMVLWLMRWSAKLNLFWGVPNFNTDWFPAHMNHLHSYMKSSRVSLFFPLSVLAASAVAINLMIHTVSAPPAQSLSTALPCVLLVLAILEHLFMALPISDSALWNRVFAREDTSVKPIQLQSDALNSTDSVGKLMVKPRIKSPASAAVPVTLSCVKSTTVKT